LRQQARQDVLIVSPYFVPGAQMMDLFRQLRSRGVRVRVLTNSLASNDAVAAHAGYARYRKPLIDAGVELYEMRADQSGQGEVAGSSRAMGSGNTPGGSKSGASRASLHSKAVFIDQRLSVVGSMNLDLRSQKKNSEVALLIRSAAFTEAATREVEATLARAVYRIELDQDQFVWRAPPGSRYPDARSEPGASTKLRMLAGLIGPFAPEEML
jgi:cardiolipin synthase C